MINCTCQLPPRVTIALYVVSTVSGLASALPEEPNYFPCVGPCNYLCIHFLSFIKEKSLRKINELDLILVSCPRGNFMPIYLCKTGSISMSGWFTHAIMWDNLLFQPVWKWYYNFMKKVETFTVLVYHIILQQRTEMLYNMPFYLWQWSLSSILMPCVTSFIGFLTLVLRCLTPRD